MFNIRNVATSGFDRAIIAMRRENGGREASDSEWKEVHGLFDMTGIREFVIGPDDEAECLRLCNVGVYDFAQFVVVWMHLEAERDWWYAFSEYFAAASEVERHGTRVKMSVMTTYASLCELVADARPDEGDAETWQEWSELCGVLTALPESWIILSGMEG